MVSNGSFSPGSYKQELLGKLPRSWRYVQVKNLKDEGILSDIQDGNHGELHPKSSDYVSFGVPFIMAKDLVDGRLSFDDCKFLSKKQADSLRVGFSKPDDVLLTHKATMGRVAIVPNDFEYIMLTPQVTYYRIGDKEQLDNVFLKYAFLSPIFQYQLNSSSDQSTRKYIGITAQGDLWLLLPPINEQRAIANILSALDDKIELNHKMNKTLEAIAQALFKSWFVDFDPVHAKMEGRQPYGMDAETAALFPDEFEDSQIGKIPRGWKVVPFSSRVEIFTGGTPKTTVAEYWDGQIPWVSIVDTQPRPYIISTEKTITEAGLENSSTKILPPETLVITARGTVGKCALMAEPMAINQSCYGLRGNAGVGQLFLMHQTLEQVAQLRANTHGSVFDTITRNTFENIWVIHPIQQLLNRFEILVRPFFDQILSNQRQSATLTSIRDALLPKLLSGEIRVKDAEKFVGTRI
jgi:type I restriction enzyme S subunit